MNKQNKKTSVMNFRNEDFEKKRQEYREWLEKNPPIFDENTGHEMKECQGCYCQLLADCHYDFCFDCLDGEEDCCVENNGEAITSKCLACYGKGKFKVNKPRKRLTFLQKQRLYWELVKQNTEDRVDEIKNYEEPDYKMRTARDVENMRRWSRQSDQRVLENLSIEEIYQEIERKKSLHKKETVECYSCKKKTNQWEFNDLEARLCPDCYKREKKSLAGYQKDYRSEQEKRGCFSWCAEDCLQQLKKEKESE